MRVRQGDVERPGWCWGYRVVGSPMLRRDLSLQHICPDGGRGVAIVSRRDRPAIERCRC